MANCLMAAAPYPAYKTAPVGLISEAPSGINSGIPVGPASAAPPGHNKTYSLSPSRTDSSAILIMSLKVV
ncbi:hypothetical protein F3H79_14555 [Citrobacter freundii]|nr:hypothetical protein [Citrobacter freundii]